jgi:hypothetical protein
MKINAALYIGKTNLIHRLRSGQVYPQMEGNKADFKIPNRIRSLNATKNYYNALCSTSKKLDI